MLSGPFPDEEAMLKYDDKPIKNDQSVAETVWLQPKKRKHIWHAGEISSEYQNK